MRADKQQDSSNPLQQQAPEHSEYLGRVNLDWPTVLPPFSRYPQNQLNVPVTGPVECVTTTVVVARNMMKDRLADKFGLAPIPDISVEEFVSQLDRLGWAGLICRVPSNAPTLSIPFVNPRVEFNPSGWMHPLLQAPHALNRLSAGLRRQYGCGFTFKQSSGNSLSQIAGNLSRGNLVLVHGLWPALDGATGFLGGMSHTMGPVVGIDFEGRTVTVLNTDSSVKLMPAQEFTDFWSRPSRANLYTKPNTMTVLVPDAVRSPSGAVRREDA